MIWKAGSALVHDPLDVSLGCEEVIGHGESGGGDVVGFDGCEYLLVAFHGASGVLGHRAGDLPRFEQESVIGSFISRKTWFLVLRVMAVWNSVSALT